MYLWMSPFSANSSSAMLLQTNTTAELLQPPHSTLAPPFYRSLNALFSTFPFTQSQMTALCQFTSLPMPRPTHVCSRSATNCQWISNRRRDAHALLYHWHSVEFPSTALTCTCQPTRCPKKNWPLSPGAPHHRHCAQRHQSRSSPPQSPIGTQIR